MRVKISDIALLNAKSFVFSGHRTIKYIDTGSVTEGIFSDIQILNTKTDSIPSRAKRGVNNNTIIVSTVRPYLKHFGIINFVPDDIVVSTGFVTIDAIPEKVDSQYLYYILTSPLVTNYLISISSTAVSSYPSFNPDDLGVFEVDIPESVEEQARIAQVLKSLDSKISNNSSICSDFESMAKLLYDYWFVQFDFPDENGKPYKSSGGKMVWNEELKREIPEGWEVKHASDLTKVRTGKEDANFATPNGKYAYFTCGQDVLRCDVPVFEGRAILLAGNGDFNVKHYSGKFNAYQRTYVLIPYESKYYALLYMATKETIARFKRGASGSIEKFITLGDVNSIVLLDPKNDSILESFNLIIEKIEQIYSENQQLSSLRDFLLPLLMNGQVKVG